jgi:endonuclease VIII
MPEGDTIHRSATVLRAALLGEAITSFVAPRVVGPVPQAGAIIESIEATGKHLHIAFDDGLVLHTHMRMTGSWHVYREGEQWRRSAHKMRCTIQVPGWVAVCFSAPVVEVFRSNDRRRHAVLGALGPDLCREDVDFVVAADRFKRFAEADTTIAEALLDQRIAAGIGNVYKSEALWACLLDPFTPVKDIPTVIRRALLITASRMLRANLDRPERITAPQVPGGLAVYGRQGKPCTRCGHAIEVRKHGEQARVTFWCPGCQVPPDPMFVSPGPELLDTVEDAPADPLPPIITDRAEAVELGLVSDLVGEGSDHEDQAVEGVVDVDDGLGEGDAGVAPSDGLGDGDIDAVAIDTNGSG